MLDQPLGDIDGERAEKKKKIPIVLNREEIAELLRQLSGKYWLAACLMYGSGLRLMECMRLRVMNLDFDHRAIHVINGKGAKDRVVTLPDDLVIPLKRYLEAIRNLHDKDLSDGFGDVYLPYAFSRKHPNAGREWGGNTSSPCGTQHRPA